MAPLEKVLLLDFSGTYQRQSRLLSAVPERISFSDLTGTNLYCDEEALGQILERIRPFGAEGLHFLDSGNTHYLSYCFLSLIEEPFCLIVFDHHTDMQPPAFGGLLSCGGWVLTSLRQNPYLEKALVIGAGQEAVREAEREAGSEKVLFAGEGEIPGGALRLLQDLDPGIPLYLSVDKDILSRKSVPTNWDQGELSLSALTEALSGILSMNRRLIGADICGEAPDEADQTASEEVNLTLLKLFTGRKGGCALEK